MQRKNNHQLLTMNGNLQKKKGNRRKPNPCDGHGCDHGGVLELKELPRAYLKSYVKEGGCLFQMPCYDCRKKVDRKEVRKEGTVRVLDLVDLLTGKKEKNDEMARYCNYMELHLIICRRTMNGRHALHVP
jgi:hypothetical protein